MMYEPPATKDFTSNNTNMEIDPKIVSRVREGMNSSEQRRQAICLPKFTSTKKATSSLRFPQREGYHLEPITSPNPPQR
jgi:hypothetical protein